MKLWIDDVRPAPEGYVWCKSVNETRFVIESVEHHNLLVHCNDPRFITATEEVVLQLIDIDHDAGEYAYDGGDYIKLLDWLEETGRSYPIHIHSMNPVGVENMRRIIQKNGWTEV